MPTTDLLPRVRKGLRTLISRFQPEPPLHPMVQKYCRFNEEEWGPPLESQDDAVFLVGIFGWLPCMPGYAHVAQHFARKASASIEWFNFYPQHDRVIEAIFASFGARPGLALDSLGIDDQRARKLGDEIFAGLKSKWDVVRIEVDGVIIGDLIYDTYLRVGPHPTANLRDPQLAEMIHAAVRITIACREYFARKKVIGIIPDHLIYTFSGIITRCALMANVPVYQVFYGEHFYAYSISCAAGDSWMSLRRPFPLFRELFAKLSPEAQVVARRRGREAMERRLSGQPDGILAATNDQYGAPVVQSAYAGETSEPVLADTGRPRMLVLLHDFCEAIHTYRDMLFPDFYEWIDFLLSKASETEFDWYVKPHPNLARGGVVPDANRRVVEQFKAKYPRIYFLEPTTSSKQIIREGVSAMFTGCGTAGHEFAYMGVPVVNAGDNPHIAYDFNIHPRTLEEYAHCIAHADSLKVNLRKEDIEEFVYMNYFFTETLYADANPLSPEFLASDEYKLDRSRPETLEHLMHRMSAEEEAKFARYLDNIPAFRA